MREQGEGNSAARQNCRGFAISIDALLATVLVLGILATVGLGTQTTDVRIASTTLNIKQGADDAFAALDRSGILAKYLADLELSQMTLSNPADHDNPGIYYEAERLLPENSGLKIVITEYLAEEDLTQCKQTKKFEDCFGSSPFAVEKFPDTSLPDKEIIHGRRIAVMKETDMGKETPEGRECIAGQLTGWLKEKEEAVKWLFQGEPEPKMEIETWIGVTDRDGTELGETNPLVCYEDGSQANETAKVTIKARNKTRDPIAIMLAMDKSGSMEIVDVLAESATGTFNQGECESQPVWVAGKFGNALSFDGVANYVKALDSPGLGLTDAITVAAWVKADTFGNWRTVVSKGRKFSHEFWFGYNNNNTIDFKFNGYAGSNISANTPITDSGWHHIAGVYDGTDIYVFLDGVLDSTPKSYSDIVDKIGSVNIGYTEYWECCSLSGLIDEVKIYNRALSAAEITQLKNDVDVPSGLLADWPFDESEGFIAHDASGNNHHGALQNWAHVFPEQKWVAGHTNNALQFDGYDDYVDGGNDASLDLSGSLTISAWVYPGKTSGGTWQRIVFRNIDGTNNTYQLGQTGGFVLSKYKNGSEYRAKYDMGTLPLNKWYHVVGTFDDSTNTVTVYVNGVGKSDSVDSAGQASPSNLLIGKRSDDHAATFFEGKIDEVRIYNRALSASEAEDLYNGVDVSNGLVSHWKLDESSGNTAQDSAGANDGTLHNWVDTVTGECQYMPGQSSQLNTNCPVGKGDYDKFTDEQHILSYDIGPIYPYINSGDYIDFIANSTVYAGACIEPNTYMRLWVERPDGVVEANYNKLHAYMEDVQNPPNGVYDINVWSDKPVNYGVWLRQRMNPTQSGLSLSGIGTHDGVYDQPEKDCSNFDKFEKITEFTIPAEYNQIYYLRWRIDHLNYYDNDGQCYAPRFYITHVSGSEIWVPGKFNNALDIDGGKNFVCIDTATGRCDNDDSNPTFDDPFDERTVALWFKADEVESTQVLYEEGGVANGLNIYIDDGKVYVGAWAEDNGWNGAWHSASVSAGPWYHVVNKFNGNGNFEMYLNDTLIDSSAAGATMPSHPGDDAIGGRRANTKLHTDTFIGDGHYFYGIIDDVRVYNRTLSEAEISTLFGGGEIASGLISHWKLDESSGRIASDSAGANNGTLAHATWVLGYCITSGSSYCEVTSHSDWDPFAPTGTYEIWGWSDVPIEVEAQAYRMWQFWGYIYGDETRNKVVSGGTCSSEPCYREAVAATTANTNCPQVTGRKMTSIPGLDEESRQLASDFNARSHLRGLSVEVGFDYSGGSDAVCPGAAMGFQNPIDGSQDPNWYYRFPAKGETITRKYGVNDDSINYRYEWDSSIPIPQGDYNILGWADKDVDYTVEWYLQRIDAAKNSAKTFIDNASWKEDDEIGVLGFSSTADAPPRQPLTTDRSAAKDALDTLNPSGETAMADAIEGAVAELENAEPGSGKFIVLLTDGKANVCRGGVACSESQAIADAIDAANDARDVYGIRIYVIGFADQSIIGSYEENLRAIAMDRDDIRFSEDCEEGALCGKYYYAADEDALQEMYNLIALEIERIMGGIEVRIPVPQGTELSNYSSGTCGIWNETAGGFFPGECRGICSSGDESTCVGGETLTYYDQFISSSLWWLARFDAVLPCNAANCYDDYVLFPPVSTELIETSNRNAVSWDGEEDEIRECGQGESIKCHKRIPFKYADLNAAFTYGLLKTGDASVSIDLEISNDGNKNIGIENSPITDGLEISFYKRDLGQPLEISEAGTSYWLGEEGDTPVALLNSIIGDQNLYIAPNPPPDDVCSWKENNCANAPYQSSYWKLRVEGLELRGCPNNDCEGTIIAKINQNGKVLECPLHNTGLLFCVMERLRFFTIDYYVWVK